jgi:hypothetical protein
VLCVELKPKKGVLACSPFLRAECRLKAAVPAYQLMQALKREKRRQKRQAGHMEQRGPVGHVQSQALPESRPERRSQWSEYDPADVLGEGSGRLSRERALRALLRSPQNNLVVREDGVLRWVS